MTKRLPSLQFLLIVMSILPAQGSDDFIYHEIKRDETVSNILWNNGIKPLYGKNGILKSVLKFNNITLSSAKKLSPGTRIKIPSLKDPELKRLDPPAISILPSNRPVNVLKNQKAKWGAELLFFNHRIRESKSIGFLTSSKEFQFALGLRNWINVDTFYFDGQLFLTKIKDAPNLPLEWGIYERIRNEFWKWRGVTPYFGLGVEQFSHLTSTRTVGVNDVSKNLIFASGPGLRKDVLMFGKEAIFAFEYLYLPLTHSASSRSISGTGYVLHPWFAIKCFKNISAEIHYQKLNFKGFGNVTSERSTFNMIYFF